MVSPLAAGAAVSDAAVSVFSTGFEQPVNAMLPAMAATSRVLLNNFCWNILKFSKHFLFLVISAQSIQFSCQ
jgi:hypothetical protein